MFQSSHSNMSQKWLFIQSEHFKWHWRVTFCGFYPKQKAVYLQYWWHISFLLKTNNKLEIRLAQSPEKGYFALSLTHTHTHTHTPSFLYQHCLYLLYRSVRGAVRENTRGRGERQSILQERKSTGVDGAPVCAFMCVSVSLMAVTLSLKNTDHLFQGFQCLWLSHTWVWMCGWHFVKAYACIYPINYKSCVYISELSWRKCTRFSAPAVSPDTIYVNLEA